MRQMIGIIRVHVFCKFRHPQIVGIGQIVDQFFRCFARIQAPGLIAWPILVV